MTIAAVDEWIKTPDGFDIFTKTWNPTTEPVAQLLLIHGFGEHVGRYNDLCTFFAENGIHCHGYDQRGFGETGKRSQQIGNNQGYHRALADINDAIHRIRNPKIPLFLFGQSMGGGLVMNFAASSENEFDGLKEVTGIIAASPLVTLSMPISPFRYYPLQVAARIVPSFVIQAGLDFNAMSHDPDVAEKLENDPLVHDYATLATVRGFLDAGKALLTKADQIHKPILYSHGTADQVNAYESTKKAYERTSSKDKTMKSWEGLKHEIHNERQPEKQQAYDYYLEWMKARIPSQ